MSRFRSLFAPLPLLQRNEERWFWLFIAPFLAGFVLFALLPLIASLALSFMDSRKPRGEGETRPEGL